MAKFVTELVMGNADKMDELALRLLYFAREKVRHINTTIYEHRTGN